jgi:hypothetical protein
VLVPVRNTAALSGALRSLIEDIPRRARLAGAARARARMLCDPEIALQRLEQVLTDMTPAGVGA